MNLTGFRNVWQNTPCTVCRPATACLPHWCCWIVLPDGATQHNFLQCNFACLCAWTSEGSFPGGALVDFSKSFFRGDESGEICFLPLETNKTAFFAEVFKLLPSSRHPCLCAGKSSCHTIQNWCNLKCFNTIPNSEIFLNFIRKIKCLTDQYQLFLWQIKQPQ